MGMGYVIVKRYSLILDIVVDNCAICRNHIMDLCKLESGYLMLTNRYRMSGKSRSRE